MSKIQTAVLVFCSALLAEVPVLHAQVSLDVSKITCEQFWLRKVANPDKVAIWLSGFYNGKRDNTVIDTQQLEAITKDVTEHCRTNLNLTVMQAAEAVMSAKK